jgi:hypothetical protein
MTYPVYQLTKVLFNTILSFSTVRIYPKIDICAGWRYSHFAQLVNHVLRKSKKKILTIGREGSRSYCQSSIIADTHQEYFYYHLLVFAEIYRYVS